jgi:hypothetical protein
LRPLGCILGGRPQVTGFDQSVVVAYVLSQPTPAPPFGDDPEAIGGQRVFGSVGRGNARPESAVDLLYSLAPDSDSNGRSRT